MFHEETLRTQHANRARHWPTFEDMSLRGSRSLSSHPCANGSNTPHSADRSLRVGPGRPTRCPWSTPGGSWSMEIRGLAQGGAYPIPVPRLCLRGSPSRIGRRAGRIGSTGPPFRAAGAHPGRHKPALAPAPSGGRAAARPPGAAPMSARQPKPHRPPRGAYLQHGTTFPSGGRAPGQT